MAVVTVLRKTMRAPAVRLLLRIVFRSKTFKLYTCRAAGKVKPAFFIYIEDFYRNLVAYIYNVCYLLDALYVEL